MEMGHDVARVDTLLSLHLMTVILSAIHVASAAVDDEHAEVIVHIHARVIASVRVRRKVNGWLCLEVGDRMLAGEPELMVGDQLIWRVPVHWTSPTTGVLAQSVGHVMVDAMTGELLVDLSTAQEMQQRVMKEYSL
jgi:hypothetical protein